MLEALAADLEEIITMIGAILLAAEVGGSQRLSEAIDALRRNMQPDVSACTKAAMLARVFETLRRSYEPRASSAGY